MLQEHELNQTILMHGPAFDGSGEIVERMVTIRDRVAYERAGYIKGPNPVKSFEKAVADEVNRQADGKPSGKAAKGK